jgi:hypothetical protein
MTTTTTQQIRLILGPDHARLSALIDAESTQYVGTVTQGSGAPNLARYAVRAAGHDLEGVWPNDAREPVFCRLSDDHPLAQAIRLVAAARRTRAIRREVQDTDYRPGALTDAIEREETARRAMKADPLAVEIGESVHIEW